MGFFDFTALAGPVPDQHLPSVPQLALWGSLIGMLVASALGILKASIGALRVPRVPVPGAAPVAPRPAAGLALAATRVPRQPAVRVSGSRFRMR